MERGANTGADKKQTCAAARNHGDAPQARENPWGHLLRSRQARVRQDRKATSSARDCLVVVSAGQQPGLRVVATLYIKYLL